MHSKVSTDVHMNIHQGCPGGTIGALHQRIRLPVPIFSGDPHEIDRDDPHKRRLTADFRAFFVCFQMKNSVNYPGRSACNLVGSYTTQILFALTLINQFFSRCSRSNPK